MKDAFRAIFEFNKKSYEPSFIKEEKEVSSAIQKILSQTYLNDGNEIELVKNTINAMNAHKGRHFRMESIFIHGNKSQIEFDYYGKVARKEMGDLVFVSTLTFMSKPFFQKMTIVQAKKDSHSRKSSWGIDQEQLFFLSYWPVFQGVKGIFPKSKIAVQDHSGCLGSYALYRDPGDFVFIAAKRLERYLGQSKRISINRIYNSTRVSDGLAHDNFSHSFFPFGDYRLIRDVLRQPGHFYDFIEMFGLLPFSGHPNSGMNVMRNELLCRNVFDTISQLARLNIGELVFSGNTGIKTNEYAYRLLNTVVRYIHRADEGTNMDLVRYNSNGPILEEIDMQGVSFGLIHTVSEVSPRLINRQ